MAAREVQVWRERAFAIPDAPIRRDALDVIARKRSHIDGAALFSIVPPIRSANLVRLSVAYQIIFDFLDSVNERGAMAGVVNGRQLHLALIDALDPDRPTSNYYRHNPWRDDGGFLCGLVDACRRRCVRLPGYEQVRELVIREALRFEVLALNHRLDPAERDSGLREWVASETWERRGAIWYEITAASSSSLGIHALFALASQSRCADADARAVRDAYVRVVATMGTMLDSYVDQLDDAAEGDHSYIAHYPNPQVASRRLGALIAQSFDEVLALPDGERHAVIVACMVAMYLAKDSTRAGQLRRDSASLVYAGGGLTRLLLPVLRLWRIAYSQRSS